MSNFFFQPSKMTQCEISIIDSEYGTMWKEAICRCRKIASQPYRKIVDSVRCAFGHRHCFSYVPAACCFLIL